MAPGTKEKNVVILGTIQQRRAYPPLELQNTAYMPTSNKMFNGFFNHLISKDAGLAWGIEYNQSSINQSDNGWVSEGHQVLLALSVITKSGINSFKIGMWVPGESTPELGTSFMMAIDLSGSTLWDWRRWL